MGAVDYYSPTYIPEAFPFYPGRKFDSEREHMLRGILWICEYCYEKCMEDAGAKVYISREHWDKLVIVFPMGKVMRNGLLPETVKNFITDFGMVTFVRGYPRSDLERTELVVRLPRKVLDITSLHGCNRYSCNLKHFITLMDIFLKPYQ
jgi:hypothetical protein